MTYPSVQLFVDRAQAVQPDFQVMERNAAAVAALCDRLEGIPLVLELAAARVKVLPPSQMLSRWEQHRDFLVSRQRDAELRHKTLWAALEWSYRLLSPELHRFFCRLSVFRGGWTEEAAEVICWKDEEDEQKDLHPSSFRGVGAVAGCFAHTGGGAGGGDAVSDAGDAAGVWMGADVGGGARGFAAATS